MLHSPAPDVDGSLIRRSGACSGSRVASRNGMRRRWTGSPGSGPDPAAGRPAFRGREIGPRGWSDSLDGQEGHRRPGRRWMSPDLRPQHAALLTASAISDEVAKARGYRSVTVKAELTELGFSSTHARGPAR